MQHVDCSFVRSIDRSIDCLIVQSDDKSFDHSIVRAFNGSMNCLIIVCLFIRDSCWLLRLLCCCYHSIAWSTNCLFVDCLINRLFDQSFVPDSGWLFSLLCWCYHLIVYCPINWTPTIDHLIIRLFNWTISSIIQLFVRSIIPSLDCLIARLLLSRLTSWVYVSHTSKKWELGVHKKMWSKEFWIWESHGDILMWMKTT
jgi:hypothetical protein